MNRNKNASSYGYYCIISHGSGYATLYAHQKQLPLVKVGDTVTVINNNEIGELSQKLYNTLTDIQWSRIPDPFGWITPCC